MIYQGKKGAEQVLANLRRRAEGDLSEVETRVKEILADVQARGDQALAEYALKFDDTDYQKTPLIVGEEEIQQAYAQVDEKTLAALRLCAANVRKYHEKQLEKGYCIQEPGICLEQLVLPLDSVGLYAPGGTAAYPSSVIMNAVPAKIAGVGKLCLATPAKHGALPPLTLVAAKESGVDLIFRMGGAQAVAAFAYGTETVPQVNKITGPGNSYVAMAKKAVVGTVGIDSIAGPSEVLVIADEVQTGVGRTGTFLAGEQFGHHADVTTLAKGIAGGLPMGACLASEKCAGVLDKGSHGSTFVGNPVCCAGGLAVLNTVTAPGFLDEVKRKAALLREKLAQLPGVESVSGLGLMIGIALKDKKAIDVANAALEEGLLVLTAKTKVRLLPPLTITDEEIEKGVAILADVLSK